MVDPESGIHQYAIAIGTSATDQSVLSRILLTGDPNLSFFTSPVLFSVDPSLPYYVILFATNGAQLESIIISEPVYFDISSPIISGGVVIYPNFKVADYVVGALVNLTSLGAESATCLLDTDVVSISFDTPQATKTGNDNFRYELGIGFRPGNDDFLNYEYFSPIPLAFNGVPSLYHRIHPLNFASVGRRGLYLTVRVHSAAGQHSVLLSNVVFIKSNLTLERSWIFDGIGSRFDMEYQSSTFEIGSRFFLGVNCPIRRGQWAVESVDGNLSQLYVYLDTSKFQNPLENTFRVTSDQVQLFSNETYRILVQATDFSGEVHILRSNGVTITTQGLIPGIVRDGPIPEQDLNYQESVTSLSACWNRFGDGTPEQEIAYYEVAAGSNRDTRSNIAPFTNVGLNRTHIFTGLQLNAEVARYFITVRAYAVSGMFVEAQSNGIVVGLKHSIMPGAITLPRFQADRTMLGAYWSDFESSLPIRQYEWALGSVMFNSNQLETFCSDTNSNFTELFEVYGFSNIEQDTYISLQGLDLQDNTTYYLTLRVLDQAKKCIAITSPEGVTIDQTPPTSRSTPTSVTLGPIQSQRSESDFVVYLVPGMDLEVEWEAFEDEESGVDFYEVGIYRQLECGNDTLLGEAVVEFVEASDDSLQNIFTNVPLEVGVAYVAVVRATNRAGVSGYAFSQPILLDDTSPVQGTVKDGGDWERDVTYQSDLSMLSAVFTHAKLPPPTPGVTMNAPCSRPAFFDLSNLDPDWTTLSTPEPIGYASSSIAYADGQVSPSGSPPGISIVTFRDSTSVRDEVISGAYQTYADLTRGGTFQADISVASGLPQQFQMNAVTSILFIDSGETTDRLAKFEPDAAGFDFFSGGSPLFNAFGIQIYREFTNSSTILPQSVVMWAAGGGSLSQPSFVRRDIPDVDLSDTNTYRVEFEIEQLDFDFVRTAHLYINEILMASLHGLPALSNSTRVVLHTFNRRGYVPARTNPNPSVRAVFANVTVPRRTGSLCDSGTPFHSRQSPIVEFQAWAGTRPGLADVQEVKVQC